MRWFCAFMIGIILNAILLAPVSAKNYSDVHSTHKHKEAIVALSDQGIIHGYPNGEFHPEGNINRAEAVKILVEALIDDNTIGTALNWHKSKNHWYVMFQDVGINQWFGKYVEVAYQKKIVEGYPDGSFKPSNNINFAEALKIILESYGVNASSVPYTENDLIHMSRNDWYAKYFAYAYEYNLINQNKFYHPAQLITRAEFVEIIYRLQTVINNDLPEFIASKLPTSNEYTVTVPKLNIINVNVNQADPTNAQNALNVLQDGLGHYLSMPGEEKKVVLFGHSSGYDWDSSAYKTILRQIDKLDNGDKIYLNYKERGYVYEIFKSDIIPQAEDYKIVENQMSNELALYTCWPPDRIDYRYVVYGKPVT